MMILLVFIVIIVIQLVSIERKMLRCGGLSRGFGRSQRLDDDAGRAGRGNWGGQRRNARDIADGGFQSAD